MVSSRFKYFIEESGRSCNVFRVSQKSYLRVSVSKLNVHSGSHDEGRYITYSERFFFINVSKAVLS